MYNTEKMASATSGYGALVACLCWATRLQSRSGPRELQPEHSLSGNTREREGVHRVLGGKACSAMKAKNAEKKRRANVSVREMEIDDLADVFHLGEKIFTAREAPNLYRTWDDYEVVNLFLNDPEFCLVAEDDEKIVGFALGTTVSKSRSAWKYGHLVWLGIEPEYQNQGIAAKLFRHFRDLMLESGVRMLLVDTEADNLSALGFFRKMGFGNPQQHIYMSLNLSERQRQFREKKDNGLKQGEGLSNDDG
jgi:ribosomal protein S18 acetylase RimI-like enzyme